MAAYGFLIPSAEVRISQGQNKGNMLKLVRCQKVELPKVAGAEEVVYSAAKIIVEENARKRDLGIYADMPTYSIPYEKVRNIAAIKNHIWGL